MSGGNNPEPGAAGDGAGSSAPDDARSVVNTREYWDESFGRERRATWYRRRGDEKVSRWLPRLWLRHHFRKPYYGRVARLARGRLLDLGCGSGLCAALHSLFSGETSFGMDWSAEAVAFGRREAIRHRLPCHFAVGDIYRPPFAEGSFDTVYLGQILEHIPDDLAAVRAAAGLLRSGGTILLSVPREGNMPSPEHVRAYDPQSLVSLLGRASDEFGPVAFHDEVDAARFVASAVKGKAPAPG